MWLPALGTALSIVACYGTLGVVTVLSLLGITLAPNVHVWAGAIVAFALLAVAGPGASYQRHRSLGPLALGIAGALVVIISLYASRSIASLGIPRDVVEILGFIGLIGAATWDWRLKR
jgi:hypothetical protein